MSDDASPNDKLERPAQLAIQDRLENYLSLAKAVLAWRRLSPEDKAKAVIYCDGDPYEGKELDALNSLV
jgi:hypothetical protein